MKKLLDGKVVLITGAGSGLGRATAIEAAQEGAKLSLVDLNSSALEETKKEVLSHTEDAEILLVEADVSDESAVQNYVKKTVDQYGRIDGFYNNAGIEGIQAYTTEYDSDTFRKVIDVNLMGVFYGMKHVLKIMEEQKSGAVVNVASVGGIRGLPSQSAYVASKHAVSGMTKVAAVEYGHDDIHVNAIAPGAILTDMVRGSFKQIGGENWEAALDEFVSVNPKKRFGEPKEVAQLVTFLMSDKSAFINGMIIPIDGG